MRLISSDPDVETIVSRIQKGEINLQPDFQRGEVWSDPKKRKLIDSILRNWHVPPIHVVELPGAGIPEVLDGQQRLVAIRDFVDGVIRVDGRIEPFDEEISKLHGLTFNQLPPEWKRKFNRFSVRFFNITDYRSDEPSELFYRLNQPVALTSAEQRNAFFGVARRQVRELVESLGESGADRDFLGFSNSRMAYDDVLARFCATVEAGTLTAKVTANTLVSKYRSAEGFAPLTLARAHDAISCLGQARPHVSSPIHFNKATLFSWLWFAGSVRAQNAESLTPPSLGRFMSYFEERRSDRSTPDESDLGSDPKLSPSQQRELFAVYNDRATARVSDVSSVLSRDIVIWIFFVKSVKETDGKLPDDSRVSAILKAGRSATTGQTLVERLIARDWGRFA